MTETAVAAPIAGGRHDFDFLFGTWRIHNRKLVDPLAEPPNDWIEFEAWSEARPILSGLGNVDTYGAPDFPADPASRRSRCASSSPRPGCGGSGGRRPSATVNSTRRSWAASATAAASSSATTSSADATSESATSGWT